MKRDRVLKIAGVQMAATADREKNRTKAGMLIELAAAEEAKIISLPQLFDTRWFPRAIDNSNFSLAEKEDLAPGNLGFPVFDTPYARIGVQLCWDIFFPEGFRILALKGAEVVFAPTASAFEHSQRKWERAICDSAHANGLFVMRVNRVGREGEQTFYGG